MTTVASQIGSIYYTLNRMDKLYRNTRNRGDINGNLYKLIAASLPVIRQFTGTSKLKRNDFTTMNDCRFKVSESYRSKLWDCVKMLKILNPTMEVMSNLATHSNRKDFEVRKFLLQKRYFQRIEKGYLQKYWRKYETINTPPEKPVDVVPTTTPEDTFDFNLSFLEVPEAPEEIMMFDDLLKYTELEELENIHFDIFT